MKTCLPNDDPCCGRSSAAIPAGPSTCPGFLRSKPLTWPASSTREEAGNSIFFQRLYQETEGNPFFIVETVRALQENGGTQIPLPVISIPNSIQRVIEARLDRLGTDSHEALACAAAIGRSFSYPLLQEILGDTERKNHHLYRRMAPTRAGPGRDAGIRLPPRQIPPGGVCRLEPRPPRIHPRQDRGCAGKRHPAGRCNHPGAPLRPQRPASQGAALSHPGRRTGACACAPITKRASLACKPSICWDSCRVRASGASGSTSTCNWLRPMRLPAICSAPSRS